MIDVEADEEKDDDDEGDESKMDDDRPDDLVSSDMLFSFCNADTGDYE